MQKIILFFSLFLFGCAPKNIPIFPPQRLPLNLPDPSPMKMKDVKFIVVTRDNAEAVFKKMQTQGLDPVIFGLSGPDYKNLAENTTELKKYIILQRHVIQSYRKYYEE